ncbi:LacI family DNA-binding transcriptional regulator [Pelagicoccus sp. SDUM812005]|uniref:LacI family DNA-binding transcriptional regulator n=1 Tax=Pelagicoccus sp. SDUM812005 TaxID=3041257 RepID=UPI00280E3C19|nr:LacI family DNA-binding transcriptional regulator [Pelagicoccus sp. SDUM812005]MDQ8180336.1 LacI family DNA-binding transcriptional regulator [Pelagicoccus sp. SDUM812005]
MERRRITIRDISREVGLGIATVSRALNNEVDVKEGTRLKVLEVAHRMGYQKDAMLSALAQMRWKQGKKGIAQTIAWIDCWPQGDASGTIREGEFYESIYKGAVSRGEELGYRIAFYKARKGNMSDARLSQILEARGTLGVILPPSPLCSDDLGMEFGKACRVDLDWDKFCAVRIGYSYSAHPFNVVVSSQFECAELAIKSMIDRGYRRIGYLTSGNQVRRYRGRFLGAVLYCGVRYKPSGISITEHVVEGDICDADGPNVRGWIEENRIEGVLGNSYEVMDLLREEGYSIPEDIGYAHVGGGNGEREVSLVDQNGKEIGRNCVDVLNSMIKNNEKGVPGIVREVQIQPSWVAGRSLREVGEGDSSFPLRWGSA